MNPRKKIRIVIAGGGFAGLYAAKHLDGMLARRTDIEVTLISRENFILFTPMLHEVAAGDLSPGDIVNSLRRILRRVKVVVAEVEAIDLTKKTIRCRNVLQNVELTCEFDHLLLALGAETKFSIRRVCVIPRSREGPRRCRFAAKSHGRTPGGSLVAQRPGDAARITYLCHGRRRFLRRRDNRRGQ